MASILFEVYVALNYGIILFVPRLEGHYFWMGSCGSCNEMTKRVVLDTTFKEIIYYVSLVLKEIESTL